MKYYDLSEGDLIAFAQQGDASAAEELLTRHKPLLRALAFRFSQSCAAQQDLIQVGCIGLIHAIRRYDASKAVLLRTYALPWIMGEMKKAARQYAAAYLSLDEPRGEEGIALSDILIGKHGIDFEKLSLNLALQRLPQEEQLVILLRYTRDMTQTETARLLKKSQAQISKTESRAIDHLRKLMA